MPCRLLRGRFSLRAVRNSSPGTVGEEPPARGKAAGSGADALGAAPGRMRIAGGAAGRPRCDEVQIMDGRPNFKDI